MHEQFVPSQKSKFTNISVHFNSRLYPRNLKKDSNVMSPIAQAPKKKPYKEQYHGFYFEKHVDRLLQQHTNGSKDEWDRLHKRALYWKPQESVVADEPKLERFSSSRSKLLPAVQPQTVRVGYQPPYIASPTQSFQAPEEEEDYEPKQLRKRPVKSQTKDQITRQFIKRQRSPYAQQLSQERARGFMIDQEPNRQSWSLNRSLPARQVPKKESDNFRTFETLRRYEFEVTDEDPCGALATYQMRIRDPKPQTQVRQTRVQRQRQSKQTAVSSPETDRMVKTLMSRHFSNGEDEVRFFLSNAAIL